MKNKNTSIDGFIPRRTGRELGGLHVGESAKQEVINSDTSRSIKTASDSKITSDIGQESAGRSINRSDIEESLKDIDDIQSEHKPSWRKRRKLKKLAASRKPKKSRAKKIILWIVAILAAAILGFGGWFVYKLISTGGSVLQGSILDIFQTQPLKEDANGRSNFLILGTSDDAIDHDGADLTDSMMVLGISQTKHDAFIFSIPRDLYVEYGRACPSGYQGKINAYLSCINTGETDQEIQDRLAHARQLVGDIFGLDIQYGMQINHSVIKEAVDAVGGIEVEIEGSNGAPGVLDRNFDWRCGYRCHLVKYDNGTHHLDGEAALFLSMARGSVAPTYGLSRGNFDREVNQQKILMAVKDKAVTSGLATNISAVMKLVNSIGKNLRTNISTSEIRTLADLTSKINSDNIQTISLVGQEDSVVTTGNHNGQSIVRPIAGLFNYTELQSFIKRHMTSDPVVRENAPLVVLNGSSVVGLGNTQAEKLKAKNYNVVLVANASSGSYQKVEIYQRSGDSQKTAKALAELYGVEVMAKEPPFEVSGAAEFVIIFGADPDA